MVTFADAGRATAPKVIDLFCGCGGFSLGAARAGFDVVAGVDFDKHAIAAHTRNFPNSKDLNLDLTETTGTEILQEVGLSQAELTGIIGGPPCQGFSSMGKNNANDPRNRLFYRFFEIVDELRPLFFVCENVPGLLRESYKSIREEAIAIVEEHYDIVGPMKLKASDYGAPTTRTRAFFVGTLKSSNIILSAEDFRAEGITQVTVKQALQGLPTKIEDHWQNETQGWRKVKRPDQTTPYMDRVFSMIPPGVGNDEALLMLREENRVSGNLGTAHESKVIQRFSTVSEGRSDSVSRAPRLDRNGFCPTLRAGTGSDRGSYQAVRPIHPTKDRVITPREAARLQGFPDWFRFDPTKWHSFRQIGNSVSPILAERLLSNIIKFLKDSNHAG